MPLFHPSLYKASIFKPIIYPTFNQLLPTPYTIDRTSQSNVWLALSNPSMEPPDTAKVIVTMDDIGCMMDAMKNSTEELPRTSPTRRADASGIRRKPIGG